MTTTPAPTPTATITSEAINAAYSKGVRVGRLNKYQKAAAKETKGMSQDEIKAFNEGMKKGQNNRRLAVEQARRTSEARQNLEDGIRPEMPSDEQPPK